MADQPTLLTKRLRLEPGELRHAEGLAAAVDHPSIQEMTATWLYPTSLEQAKERMQRTEASRTAGQGFSFIIIDRASDQVMGIVGGSFETNAMGYFLCHAKRNQGYMSEALEAVFSYLFEIRKQAFVEMSAYLDNAISLHLFQKFGLAQVEEFNQPSPNKDGVALPSLRYRLSAEGYFAQKQASGCFGAAQVSQAAKLVLVSAAVLIDRDGRILLAQRPEGKSMAGLWEFPGGKVEPGESPELALCRELKEELGIDVTTSCLAPLTFASHAYETFHLLMPLYAIRVWEGQPESREGQALKWVPLNKLRDYPMPPADVPLVPLLFDLLN